MRLRGRKLPPKLLGPSEVAGTFVNPKGLMKRAAIVEAASQIGGAAAEILAGKIGGAAADDSTPSFDTVAYLALTEDEVLVVQASTDMIRWATVGPEVGRASRSAVASAELDRGHWSSALSIGFADGGRWQFEVRRPHRDTAEQVARALGGRVG